MRHVILSELSVILAPGGKHITELVAGDTVQGYDPNTRRVVMATLSNIEKLPEHLPVPRAMASGYRVIPILNKTMAMTPSGLKPLGEGSFVGHCNTNPSKLLVRDIGYPTEPGQLYDIIELFWEGQDYIWADGLLVGCLHECNS
jgi:hypothetical protein